LDFLVAKIDSYYLRRFPVGEAVAQGNEWVRSWLHNPPQAMTVSTLLKRGLQHNVLGGVSDTKRNHSLRPESAQQRDPL